MKRLCCTSSINKTRLGALATLRGQNTEQDRQGGFKPRHELQAPAQLKTNRKQAGCWSCICCSKKKLHRLTGRPFHLLNRVGGLLPGQRRSRTICSSLCTPESRCL